MSSSNCKVNKFVKTRTIYNIYHKTFLSLKDLSKFEQYLTFSKHWHLNNNWASNWWATAFGIHTILFWWQGMIIFVGNGFRGRFKGEEKLARKCRSVVDSRKGGKVNGKVGKMFWQRAGNSGGKWPLLALSHSKWHQPLPVLVAIN